MMTPPRRLRLALLFATCVLAVQGCDIPFGPKDGVFIDGVIVARDLSYWDSDPSPNMLVKQSLDERCGTLYSLGPSTKILRETGGTWSAATQAELGVGVHVSVWTGLVFDSCPGQSGTYMVLIRG